METDRSCTGRQSDETGALTHQLQALDVVRSIDGQPFTAEALSSMLGLPPASVAGFCCNEAETVRYKQSVAARVRLLPVSAATGAFPDNW